VNANAATYNTQYSLLCIAVESPSGGGDVIYIYDDFDFKQRPDLCIDIEDEYQCIATEIEVKNGKRNLIVPNPERESIETVMINSAPSVMVSLLEPIKTSIILTDSNRNASDLVTVFFTLGTLPSVLAAHRPAAKSQKKPRNRTNLST
jgi:hypothetical protein